MLGINYSPVIACKHCNFRMPIKASLLMMIFQFSLISIRRQRSQSTQKILIHLVVNSHWLHVDVGPSVEIFSWVSGSESTSQPTSFVLIQVQTQREPLLSSIICFYAKNIVYFRHNYIVISFYMHFVIEDKHQFSLNIQLT